MQETDGSIHVGVDVGGTFTDVVVSLNSKNHLIRHKVPSEPSAPDKAIMRAVTELFAEVGIDLSKVIRFSHGTTVGTNALIQRTVGKGAIVTTEGFKDLLAIGRQTRPYLYDLQKDNPDPLIPRDMRFEVCERVLSDGRIFKKLDEQQVLEVARKIGASDVDFVVVCFLNSYAFPDHERRAAELLRSVLPSSVDILTSISVYPEFREYERFSTAVLNGALRTVLAKYLAQLSQRLSDASIPVDADISQSDGGLMPLNMAKKQPIRTALSSPAAGVIGAAESARRNQTDNIITLDVGGTSADVCLIVGGAAATIKNRTLGGFPLLLPALDVNAVGAGGGSIAKLDVDGLVKVGPESVGADPGPACYGKGNDHPTLTDANVFLGRLHPEFLLDGRMPIRRELAEAAIGRLANEIGTSSEEAALGIVQIASANMVRAIRSISVEKGHDPSEFTLMAYGGAGPLCATEVARELRIGTILINENPGILCAEGLLHSHLSNTLVRSFTEILEPDIINAVNEGRDELLAIAQEWFDNNHITQDNRKISWEADLRYVGQNYELSIPVAETSLTDADIASITADFHAAHEAAYGVSFSQLPIEIINCRANLVGKLSRPGSHNWVVSTPSCEIPTRLVTFGAEQTFETPVFRRERLEVGDVVRGPLIIEQMDTTIPIYPGDDAEISKTGALTIRLNKSG